MKLIYANSRQTQLENFSSHLGKKVVETKPELKGETKLTKPNPIH